MSTFHLSIVAPDRSVLEEPVESAVLPGTEGYFGVLAGHMPFIAALKPGVVEYSDGKTGSQFVAVSGGFAEVTGDKVTVLADAAERAHEIDVARAEKAIEEAKRALRGEESAMPREEAVDALNRAMNRVRAGTQARQG